MKNIAIIPARSGSKRIRNKNLQMLGGKPLIEWTIQSALNSKLFDLILVSTDSVELESLVNRTDSVVSDIRPRALCDDHSTACDVIKYYVDRYDGENFCYLQPTSPLRSEVDIIDAYQLMVGRSANAVVSVTATHAPSSWMFGGGGDFAEFLGGLDSSRSQDLQKLLYLNGAVYWFTKASFERYGTHLVPINSVPYRMPYLRSIDIDEWDDLKLAESIMRLTSDA